MANNIRGYNTTYKLLRNVSNPIMIIGLPLNLALIYGAGMFIPIVLLMVLKAMGAGMVFNIAIPAIVGITVVGGVRSFYKKYGVNGFALQKRDSEIPSEIEGDASVQQILKGKIKKY